MKAVEATSDSTLRQIRAIEAEMGLFAEEAKAKAPRAYSKELVELLFYRPYCKIQFLVEEGVAKRQAASTYLRALAEAGLLHAITVGREKIYVNRQFVDLLSRPYVEEIDTSPQHVDS
jgi:hypothetical protein